MDQIYKEITKGIRKPKNKIAIFLCGASGSGKTTMLPKFLNDIKMKTTFVTLNIDQIRPLVGTQEATRPVFQELIDETIKDGYSFLYDGTCRDKNNITRRVRELKERGYKVILGITYASLGTVLGRVQRRTDQPLEDDKVRDIYDHLKKHVELYMSMEGIDEIYLYNNEKSTKLIFTRKSNKVTCLSPESNFYFDVSKYC